jgi:signal transduction histidine kinase/ActR/RegA family two-component response regulator
VAVRGPDFRVLFESAPGLYLVLTPDFRIVAVSDAYLKATMTKRDEILGRGIFEVFPDNPDDPAASGVRNLRASLERVVHSKRADAMAVQKYDIRRPDSEGGGFEERHWSPVNSPVLGPGGELAYVIHRVEDVTEFVRLKRAGREMTEALRIHAEKMESEVYLRAQELSEVNQQLRTANEELARLYEQIATLMARADDELGAKLGGEAHPEPIAPEDMLDRVGQMIAGHKRLEEQLRHSQKMEAVGRLAGGIAHDFNNLLTVIVGYTRLVLDRLAAGDPLRAKVLEVLRAGEQATLLTGQLLAFSRKQATQPCVLDLNDVVAEMRGLLSRLLGEDVDLSMILSAAPCMVKADAGQMTQVLMNLAVNARDAMPGGGKLTIETQTVTRQIEDVGRHGVRPAGRYAMLAVSDSGEGMDSTTQAFMFEPFFTTKGAGKGTGLGLSIVYGVVQQHGGWIDVYSEPGHGTSFRIFFPLVAAARTEALPPAPEPPVRRIGTILLVEDQAPVRMLAEDVLVDVGHRVLTAGNGVEALETAEAFEGSIDLLITDVVMPGMSGPELAARLARARPAMGILYVSGYTDQTLMHRGVIEAGTAFLSKPFTPEALVARVSELLAARERESGAANGAAV